MIAGRDVNQYSPRVAVVGHEELTGTRAPLDAKQRQ